VLRQALEERVRPLLFINKVDRLIKELKLTPEEIQKRFVEIIRDINTLINEFAEPEFREKWRLDPAKGMVIFGSARDKIGISVPMVKKKGIKIMDMINAYAKGREAVEELQKLIPLHEALLDAVIKFVPNPREAQRYRIPKIWKGDLDSELGKAMLNVDPNGPLVFFINDMRVDPHAGLVATGRVFSGTLQTGSEVWLLMARSKQRILQTGLYMGPYRESVGSVTAGNIAAVLGLDRGRAGETAVAIEYKDAAAPSSLSDELRMVSL